MFRTFLIAMCLLDAHWALGESTFNDNSSAGPPPKSSPATQPANMSAGSLMLTNPHPGNVVLRQSTSSAPEQETLDSLGQRAHRGVLEAEAIAREYLRRAEAETEASLTSDPHYESAEKAMEAARKKLADARLVGSTQDKLAASTAFVNASTTERQLRDQAYAESTAYQDAKQLLSQIDAVAQAQNQQSDESKAREIATAISRRNLVLGMTFDEACRAAHVRPELLSINANTKIYLWKIATGTVEATFVNDKLTSFRKYEDH